MLETTLPSTINILSGDQVAMAGALLISALLGSFLGIERAVAGKQAGMRTYALVSMGSCLFVLLSTWASQTLAPIFPGVNPLQIAGSVVIGIGFIGSGLLASRAGEMHVELTTASGVWVVAAIGMACGFGFYLLAIVATVLAASILTLFLRLENSVRKKYHTGQ